MTLQGNGESTPEPEEDDNDTYHTSRDNDDEATIESIHPIESDETPQSMNTEDQDRDEDESSDTVVISPPSSPMKYGMSSDKAGSEKVKVILTPETSSFIQVGFQRKATPLALKSWAALALTLDGRDKITKVLQYASRLLGWWFIGRSKNQAMRFTTLYKQLANSRKAYRLGRSFIELEKLRPNPRIILWHLKNKANANVNISKNSDTIGLEPLTTDQESKTRWFMARSLGNIAYWRIYHPILSRISSTFESTESPSTELWKICGTSLKIIGLLGFWAGDNCSFLLSTGAFDNFYIPQKERLKRRKRLMTFASKKANQSYFIGSLVGLLVNWYSYREYYRKNILDLEEDFLKDAKEKEEDEESTVGRIKKLKEKQFSLFLGLLKSACDIMVFTNLPGIDLHEKWRGKKNHEGLHCMCGLISAGTVIYNNFPDSK
jgi:hypothetical protein